MSWHLMGPYCDNKKCKKVLAGVGHLRLVEVTVEGNIRSHGGTGVKKRRKTIATFCDEACLKEHLMEEEN